MFVRLLTDAETQPESTQRGSTSEHLQVQAEEEAAALPKLHALSGNVQSVLLSMH